MSDKAKNRVFKPDRFGSDAMLKSCTKKTGNIIGTPVKRGT